MTLRRRTPALKRNTGRKALPRRRDTGPSAAVRRTVLERSGGWCERCGTALHDGHQWIAPHSIHHRRARGMGGTTDPVTNTVVNLLLLCGTGTTGCHGWVESNRLEAIRDGYLLAQSDDPGYVPVVIAPPAFMSAPPTLMYLTTDGGYQEVEA